MKKYNLLVLVFVPLLFLLYSNFGYGSSANSTNKTTNRDGVANERPPLTADQLAEHWKLDCHKIAVEAVAVVKESWPETVGMSKHPDVSGLDVSLKELQLCAFIYNTKGTGRYQPCPSYEKALLTIKKSAAKNKAKEFPTLIENYLTSCGKD